MTIQEFLRPFREGQPTFVLTDGFPGDLLPRPLVSLGPPQTSSPSEYVPWIVRPTARPSMNFLVWFLGTRSKPLGWQALQSSVAMIPCPWCCNPWQR